MAPAISNQLCLILTQPNIANNFTETPPRGIFFHVNKKECANIDLDAHLEFTSRIELGNCVN